MSGPGSKWQALVLAASRGPDDPMARRYGVSHKCLIEVGGRAMLARVLDVLLAHRQIDKVQVCIEQVDVLEKVVSQLSGDARERVVFVPSASSAPASVLAGLDHIGTGQNVLVTTADHALRDS